MARYNSYRSNNDISRISSDNRSAERAAEASRNVSIMQSDVLRINILLQAMMEIMIEQGIDPALINAKIDEIMEKPETFTPLGKESKPCPKCGKTVLDNGNIPLVGTCMYCGTQVKFPPYVKTGDEAPLSEENPEAEGFPLTGEDPDSFF